MEMRGLSTAMMAFEKPKKNPGTKVLKRTSSTLAMTLAKVRSLGSLGLPVASSAPKAPHPAGRVGLAGLNAGVS